MKVGDIVYIFDSNHRIYSKDKTISGGPIYREHFVERQIVDETSRSWLVGFKGAKKSDLWCLKKYPKKDCTTLYTFEQIDEEVYRNDHAYKISELVRRADYKTLKTIAQMVGYKEVK